MGEKIPKLWIYLGIVLVILLGVLFAGRGMLGQKGDVDRITLALADKSRELEEKKRQIQGLDSQVAQLKKELDERSKREDELKSRLDEASKALSSAQKQLKSAPRVAERQPPTQPQPRERVATRPPDPPPLPPAPRRSAEAGSYEVVRNTSVFDEPSSFGRKVATVEKGTRITVVGSVGEWLEVRSKHGNPPGFIRRDDAMLVERRN